MRRAVAALLVLCACTSPSYTYRDYERKAAHTADEAASAVQSALLTVDLVDGRAPRPYLSVLLGDAEATLGAVQQTFEGVQPPDGRADQLREALTKSLDDAGDVLAQLRIEVRRGRLGALPGIAAPLEDLHTELETFAEDHR
jgi:hypothetical protein